MRGSTPSISTGCFCIPMLRFTPDSLCAASRLSLSRPSRRAVPWRIRVVLRHRRGKRRNEIINARLKNTVATSGFFFVAVKRVADLNRAIVEPRVSAQHEDFLSRTGVSVEEFDLVSIVHCENDVGLTHHLGGQKPGTVTLQGNAKWLCRGDTPRVRRFAGGRIEACRSHRNVDLRKTSQLSFHQCFAHRASHDIAEADKQE